MKAIHPISVFGLSILIIVFTLSYQKVTGQHRKHFIDEIGASVNLVPNYTQQAQGKLGFGLAANHYFFSQYRVNMITGFEFNHTSVYFRVYQSFKTSNPYYYDLGFRINQLSFVNMGRLFLFPNKRFFIDEGISLDLDLWSRTFSGDDFTSPNGLYMVFGLGTTLYYGSKVFWVKIDYKYPFAPIFDNFDTDINKHQYMRFWVGYCF
jgi:hypothetical protein